MTTIAVVICDTERFRVLDNGQVQRWTENGWQRFTSVASDGLEGLETEEQVEGATATLLSAAVRLHFLFGWDISEVNANFTREALMSDGEGFNEKLRDLENHSALQTASINYVGREV